MDMCVSKATKKLSALTCVYSCCEAFETLTHTIVYARKLFSRHKASCGISRLPSASVALMCVDGVMIVHRDGHVSRLAQTTQTD